VNDVELIKGSGGVFDVRLGNTLIFSKHQVGRFPETSEIAQKLRSA
jgi:selenoprotein W-related protein